MKMNFSEMASAKPWAFGMLFVKAGQEIRLGNAAFSVTFLDVLHMPVS